MGQASGEPKLPKPIRVYSAVNDGGKPLKVVYWNVASIPGAGIDVFLKDLDDELQWDILILLEFSGARLCVQLSGIRSAGHLVAAQPVAAGRRAGALVFHSRLGVHEVVFVSHGRAVGADFSWGRWNLRIIGGHADANGDRVPYQRSIDDMEAVIESTPKDHFVILGVDTQQCLGPFKAFDCPDILGEYVMGDRDWRGDCFLKLLYAYDLHLPHTFVEGFDKRYTCINNGRSDPKQIDYMATTIPRKYVVQAKVAEATSASSDHWPLSLALLPSIPQGKRKNDKKKTHTSNPLVGI